MPSTSKLFEAKNQGRGPSLVLTRKDCADAPARRLVMGSDSSYIGTMC